MQKTAFQMTPAEIEAFLAEQREFFIAASLPGGTPMLRPMNGVWSEGCLSFHGSGVGEKDAWAGRAASAVVTKTIANIPSYFRDDERACPATTFFESVCLEGTIEAVESVQEKAQLMSTFMARLQPEGGHIPLSADHPLYSAPLRGLAVYRLLTTRVTGKRKLGQHLSEKAIQRLLTGLWKRGAKQDLQAINLIVEAYPTPIVPEFLRGPEVVRFACAPGKKEAEAVYELLKNEYWTQDTSSATLISAHLNSAAWIVAKNENGEVIASVRAISDGARHAYVADMVVRSDYRRHGLGTALMRVLADHPACRQVEITFLRTRDAQGFYDRLGFVAPPSYPTLVRRLTPAA